MAGDAQKEGPLGMAWEVWGAGEGGASRRERGRAQWQGRSLEMQEEAPSLLSSFLVDA